jgi:hypothetical protein
MPFGPENSCTNTLFVFGGSASLKPEKATTWTIGADLTPSGESAPRVSATYFHIHYKDRIANPQNVFNPFDIYSVESEVGALLTRNPSTAVTAPFTSLPSFFDFSGGAPIGALFDARVRNLSILDTHGVDIDIAQPLALWGGRMEFGLDGTWLFNFKTRVTSTAPESVLLNTPYNPLRMKARARATYQRSAFNANVFANYVSAYEDPASTPATDIASWTTADVVLGYACTSCNGVLAGTELSLSVLNIADKAPPFVKNANGFAINYDGANANALGRYYALQIGKRW